MVYVWNYLEWGGAQVYFLGIAARIKDRIGVKFVFPKGTNHQFINFCEQSGIEYEFLELATDLGPAPSLNRKIARHLNKARAEKYLLGYLKKFDFTDSVLHIELTPWQSMLSLLWLCRRADEVFITMHNALPAVARWRYRLWKLKFAVLSRFENFHIFASNADARRSLQPFVPEKFLERVEVTYTNVNPQEIDDALDGEIDRNAYLKKFGLPEDKFLVFCLGQFIDRKGRWVFLEAAEKLLETTDDLAFVWISNSVLTPEEQSRIDAYRLKNSFFLIKSEAVGERHLELMKFLRIADLYTLPSFVEGLPISLLEAMALGIPSISTNVYAIPEAVKNLETGILIEPGDSHGLAEAIAVLKNDPALRERLGREGRAWVLKNFNEKSVAEIAFQSYRKAFETKQ